MFIENLVKHGWSDPQGYRIPAGGGVNLLALTNLTSDAEVQIDAPDLHHYASILLFGTAVAGLSDAARRALLTEKWPLVEVMLWNGRPAPVQAEPPQT
jgi:hypothetical protein